MISDSKCTLIADSLTKARLDRHPVSSWQKTVTDLDLDSAYKIQELGIKYRVSRGEKVVGYKMGLTSKAKMEQMGLFSPIYGVLTDRMEITNQSVYQLGNQIHPKAEPEIAFVISKPLKGAVTHHQILNSVAGVCVALEILDSRYKDFKYFSLNDVIADNASSSHFVLGKYTQNVSDIDFSSIPIEMEVVQDGKSSTVFSANGAEILGNCLNSIIELCKLLALKNTGLEEGQIVLTGAATLAITLTNNTQVLARAGSLGVVRFKTMEV